MTAMEKEALPLCQRLGQMVGDETIGGVHVRIFVYKTTYIYLVKTGIGEIMAAAATQLVVDRYKVDYIINFGFVGSFSKDLKAGDVVLIDRVAHYQFDLSGIDNTLLGQYEGKNSVFFNLSEQAINWVNQHLQHRLNVVTIASGDEFVCSKQKKDFLANTFDASVCDMELAGIVITALRNNTACISIKIVSDNADDSAAFDFQKSVARGFIESETIFTTLLEVLSE